MDEKGNKVERQALLYLEECEGQLKLLGLTDQEIDELGAIIDVIGDTIFDRYFAEFYE